jgi:oxalate decarboxylase/phosphoglucose isomerase-like protein (cupin superfamily)
VCGQPLKTVPAVWQQVWQGIKNRQKPRQSADKAMLTEDQSTYIPLGTAHRLENPGKIPLHVIEVRSGSIPARTTSSASMTTTAGRSAKKNAFSRDLYSGERKPLRYVARVNPPRTTKGGRKHQ